MRTTTLLALLAMGVSPLKAFAGGYQVQASFNVPASTVAGLDSDSVGNLYVLGLTSGAATYSVSGFRTPNLDPQFSFDSGVSTPAAFAVEPSGIVDILGDSGGAFTLRRFQNPGVFVGSATYTVGMNANVVSTAIDKVNGRVYVAFQFTQHVFYLQCIGCATGPSTITRTAIDQYDMQGNLLGQAYMPGADSTPGSCYTPTKLAVDPQGDLYIADQSCAKVLKYSPSQALLATYTASSWSLNFAPRAMWTDSGSFLYISQPVCGTTGCPQGIVKLSGDGALQTSVLVDAPVACAWDQRVLYVSLSRTSPLQRFIYASPLTVPAETGPIGAVVQHSSVATFGWQQSSSAEGDPVTYSIYAATTPTTLQSLGSASQTSLTSAPLAFGATYYWQVVAQAAYLGMPLQPAQAPVVSFNQNLVNRPPGAFSVAGGTGTVLTRATSVTLAWQPAVDPDGDPVTYDLFWRPAGQSTATLMGATSATNWSIGGLSFGATYYWSVRATDVYGAASWLAGGAEQSYSAAFANSAPPAPAIASDSGTIAQHTWTPQATLSWGSVSDPDGDPVGYRLLVGTSPALLTLVQNSAQTSDLLQSMAQNATYYWQVAAYDPYGAASTTTVQTLRTVLQNQPPSAVFGTAGTGTLATRDTAQSLAWTTSIDPDGDAVTYDLALGTTASSLALVQSAPLTSYLANVLLGTTYYWQVTARDGFGGAQASVLQTFLPVFKNSPPSVPSVVLGTGTVLAHTHAPQASLGWSAAVDPDGDAVAYRLYFGTAPTGLALVQDGAATSGLVAGLRFETTYFWQVAAYDAYGGASTTCVQSVLLRLADSPPAPIVYLSTASSLSLHTSSPTATLAWAASADPDGDPVLYELDVNSGSGAWAVYAGSATAVTIPLRFDTPYQWRVAAADPFGGVSTGAWMTLAAHLANLAPNPIQYLAPATLKTRATSYLLAWSDTGDPDGDPVLYTLEVGNSSAALAVVQISSVPAYLLPLQFGTTVYYRVTAQDPFGAATAGNIAAFLSVFLNDPPQSPNVMSPFKTSPVVKTMKNAVNVSWEQVTNPQNDPISYTVYFGDSAQNLAPLATIAQTTASGATALSLRPLSAAPQAQVQIDGSTILLDLTGLDYYHTYVLQVAASNPYGATSFAPVQTFSLASSDGFPKAYNYPNPFSPTRGGTNLVFNAPPSGYAQATVEIYSEWQDLLFRQDYFNVPPGISQIHLDGRDRNGRPFYNGSYVCRVRFSGPDDKETFYLMVVK